jgi:hypothetical protein
MGLVENRERHSIQWFIILLPVEIPRHTHISYQVGQTYYIPLQKPLNTTKDHQTPLKSMI